MNDENSSRTFGAGRGDTLGLFGFDGPSDDWLEQLRQAESPLPFGCLGPYEVEEEISRGGQGIVFRARQPGTQRRVALKRLLGGSFATPAMRRRFEREVEALTSLNHPHIVGLLAMDLVDGVPVLAMEWIEGVPITQWTREKGTHPSGRSEIVRTMLTVCDAIHHAHQRGVIHRDLKPSNILIDTSDQPHVVDFGLAKSSPRWLDPAATATGQFVGTLAYASPEQLRGQEQEVDVRSDVYSLGIVLYELLTGRRPYELGDSLGSAALAVEHADPVRPSSLMPGFDRDLEAIVLKALKKEKSARYQSADSLAGDLRNFLAGERVSARVPGGWDQLCKTFRRHRTAFGIGTTVVVLVSLFAVVTTLLAIRLAEQRDLALQARRNEVTARHDAELESVKSGAISDFLQSMLAAADPRRAGDPPLTVREVLDAAAERLGSQLDEQPEVQAEIRRVIGNSYMNLGLPDKAESQLESALAVYRSLPGDHREATFNLLSNLATTLHSQGDHQRAGAITVEAIGLYRELLADGYPLLGASLDGLAGYLFVKGDYEAAEGLYREALAAHRQMLGEHHPAVGSDMAELACLLAQFNEFDEAIRLARQSLAIAQIPGRDTPELASSLFSLGRVLQPAGEYDEARQMYEQALAVQYRVYGADHAIVADTLAHYAHLMTDLGQLGEAAQAFRRSMVMKQQLYGDDHRGAITCQGRLGEVLLEAGRTGEAEAELRAALEAFERMMPAGHRIIAKTRHNLGRCLAAGGQYEEAEAQLLACEQAVAAYGDDDPQTQAVRSSLAALYKAWNRPGEAGP